jgi:predicted HicB family RNase H-like nuclease
MQCDSSIMKRRDDQITLRVAGTLRAALEDEAAAESRGLSNLIRKILCDHAAIRIAERQEKAA